MNTHITLALVVALTGCATPPQKTQVQPTVQSSPCHSQLVSQRLFMMIAGRGLQTGRQSGQYPQLRISRWVLYRAK